MKVCEKGVSGFCPEHLEGKKELPFPEMKASGGTGRGGVGGVEFQS